MTYDFFKTHNAVALSDAAIDGLWNGNEEFGPGLSEDMAAEPENEHTAHSMERAATLMARHYPQYARVAQEAA